MHTVASVVVVALLALGSGCARTDWIEQTLVTVDVTGTWVATGPNLQLTLKQEGQKVTGSMRSQVPNVSGTIVGTVTGDVFRFRQTSGTDMGYQGELTMSGDELFGKVFTAFGRATNVVLRRLSSSTAPPSE